MIERAFLVIACVFVASLIPLVGVSTWWLFDTRSPVEVVSREAVYHDGELFITVVTKAKRLCDFQSHPQILNDKVELLPPSPRRRMTELGTIVRRSKFPISIKETGREHSLVVPQRFWCNPLRRYLDLPLTPEPPAPVEFTVK